MRSNRNRASPARCTGIFDPRLLPVVDAALRRVLGAWDPDHEDLLQSTLMAVIAAMQTGV
jgi:hypothetical protein